jgi:hypothetical protein
MMRMKAFLLKKVEDRCRKQGETDMKGRENKNQHIIDNC